MAEKKTVAAEGSKRKGQKTRAELIKDNDALQMILSEQAEEIESLKASREAWVRKCEELTGQMDDVSEERERLKELSEDYLKGYERCEKRRSELESALYDLRDHPWQNLWNHIKAVLGIG